MHLINIVQFMNDVCYVCLHVPDSVWYAVPQIDCQWKEQVINLAKQYLQIRVTVLLLLVNELVDTLYVYN